MTSLTYDPRLTTAGDDVAAPPSDSSISPLPDAQGYILIQRGFLPRDQEYYWTDAWQSGEIESRAELAAGRGVRFESADDAIRWLLSDDD